MDLQWQIWMWLLSMRINILEALIQIAGRVGRKLECPTGKVLFFHEGVSMNMIQAKKRFKR